MRKLLFALIIIFPLSLLAQDCEIDTWIEQNYDYDAYYLALKEIQADTAHQYYDSVVVPTEICDKYLGLISSVYELDTEVTDSLFNHYYIHTRGGDAKQYFHKSMSLTVDTSYQWVKDFISDSVVSGHTTFDSLIGPHSFKLTHVMYLKSGTYIDIETTKDLNLLPLATPLKNIVGIESVYASTDVAGDGDDILISIENDSAIIKFKMGWGDCPSGCINNHYWEFVVKECSAKFEGSYGNSVAPIKYTPFDFENGIWIGFLGMYGDVGKTYNSQYYTNGDTIINETSYYQMYEYKIALDYPPGYRPVVFDGYRGAIRENKHKQIEYIHNNSDESEIIYDFNLTVGDSIKNGYGKNLEILSIDSILYCGNYHKRYYLGFIITVDHYLIEGIGFSAGLFEPDFAQFESRSSIECYTEKGNDYCEECDLLLSNHLVSVDEQFSIYPNPFNQMLNLAINNTSRNITVDIININGQVVYNNQFSNSKELNVDLSTLEKGIYFIKVRTESDSFVRKVVKN